MESGYPCSVNSASLENQKSHARFIVSKYLILHLRNNYVVIYPKTFTVSSTNI